jgi:hypothetical protein
MDKPEENMVNAGIIFMFSVWLQGQMSDLVILKNNPHLIADFLASPERVPNEFHKIRINYWEKQFANVKKEFESAFESDLSKEEKKTLKQFII